MDESARFSLAIVIAVWTVFATLLGVTLQTFDPPRLAWVLFWAWVVLAVTAAFMQSDPKRRAYLIATLKHRRYTQLYLSIARPLNDWVWRRVGRMEEGVDGAPRPPNEREGLSALMRDAMTGRLLDRALLFASLYPVGAILFPWLLGQASVVGPGVVVFSPSDFWPTRALILALLLQIFIAIAFRSIAERNARQFNRIVYLLLVFIASSISLIVLLVGIFENHDTITFSFIATVPAVIFLGFTLGIWPGGITLIGIAGGIGGAAAIRVNGLAFIAPIFLFLLFALLAERRHPKISKGLVLSAWLWGVVVLFLSSNFADLSVGRKTIVVFLAVLPFINGLFDTLSYAATLATMRKGLATPWAWALGVLDLLIGGLLFLALGATMVAVIAALNALGNAPLYDLSALFAGLRSDPGDYWWLYLILFSTLLPTALHLGIAALALQGVIPRAARRWVAQWIDASPTSALDAVRGCLFQSLIWWLPLLGLAGLGYALWLWLGHAAGVAGLFYLDALETLALWIGAL